MPRPSRRRVQCPDPNCQAIKSSRGNHYFVCDECRRTWDIEPNLFDQQDKGENTKNDSIKGQDSGDSDGQDRGSEDMGQIGNSQTHNNEDGSGQSSGGVEKETETEGSDRTLELV